jgi:hypothetical protein
MPFSIVVAVNLYRVAVILFSVVGSAAVLWMTASF